MTKTIIIITMLYSSILSATETMLKLYRPFGQVTHDASGQQAPIVVHDKKTGFCFQQSLRIKREDAWRCQVDNKVYDPCFVNPASNHQQAICPASPWEGTSVELNVTEPLDNSQHALLDASKAYPWAVELVNGVQCQAVDDGEMVGDLPVRYRCDDQTVLMGHLQRCNVQWTMLQRQQTNVIDTVNISNAWF